MSFRRTIPSFDITHLAEPGSAITISDRVEPSKSAQLVLTLGEMKNAITKDLGVKAIADMDEISLANAYAYELRRKFYRDSSFKPSYIPSKKAIVCKFQFGASAQSYPSRDTAPTQTAEQLRNIAIHVALLGDDINESSVIFEPGNFHPENVVGFLRKSVDEWATGRVTSNLIRFKNYFVASDASLTREIPEDWQEIVDLDEEE